MSFEIREMLIADYDTVLALWQATEGVGLSAADSREAIERYLTRNPGMSFVACSTGVAPCEIVGAVLAGHDGRRGYLHHLAVRPEYRKQGLGQALVERSMACLRAEGIDKCHLFVFTQNEIGRAFWEHSGWTKRNTLIIMSKDL